MKVRLLSDLHLEVNPYEIKYGDEDILILAGDISPDFKELETLVQDYLDQDDKVLVIFVLGNHDYYGRPIHETIEYYKNLKIPRFIFLHDDSTVINGIRFYGCTLWTNMVGMDDDLAVRVIADYKGAIPYFSTYMAAELHRNSKKHLQSCLTTSAEPVVVITHHMPSFKSVKPEYYDNPTNPSFFSHLDDLVIQSKMWIHGHTHSTVDYFIGESRVVCNPRGNVYNGNPENKQFKEYFFLEISK